MTKRSHLTELASRLLYPGHPAVTAATHVVPPPDGGLYLGWGTRGTGSRPPPTSRPHPWSAPLGQN